jgi:hypothetical protein
MARVCTYTYIRILQHEHELINQIVERYQDAVVLRNVTRWSYVIGASVHVTTVIGTGSAVALTFDFLDRLTTAE